jgi:hypothetical protein
MDFLIEKVFDWKFKKNFESIMQNLKIHNEYSKYILRIFGRNRNEVEKSLYNYSIIGILF